MASGNFQRRQCYSVCFFFPFFLLPRYRVGTSCLNVGDRQKFTFHVSASLWQSGGSSGSFGYLKDCCCKHVAIEPLWFYSSPLGMVLLPSYQHWLGRFSCRVFVQIIGKHDPFRNRDFLGVEKNQVLGFKFTSLSVG